MLPCQPPTPLQPGDRLRVIAPSGCLRETTAFYKGIEIWRSRGYRIELSEGVNDRWGYLAGTDERRRAEFNDAWHDRHCRGILCARGGYGGARLLEGWQGSKPDRPKWLVGFSDITGLLWRLTHFGISGVHAPLLTTLAAEPERSRGRLFDWVEGRKLEPIHGNGWGGGSATGVLFPANLTVATHLLGTPVQPNLDGAILALEDVSEAPYRLDRMLTQWRMMGWLHRVGGIALGRFSRCDPPPDRPSFGVEEVLRDRLSDLGIPVVSDFPFGHEGENAALPVGVMATLDGDRGTLEVLSEQQNG